MALPKSYLTSTKNLQSILVAIQGAQAPERFSLRFLEALGFPSSNDQLIVGELKELGFLYAEGRPLDRYFRYLDRTQAPRVLAEGIRHAYSDLFSIKSDAEKFNKNDLINKVKTLSQGSLSESVLEKFATTFAALVKLADFSDPSPPGDYTPEPSRRPEADRTGEAQQMDATAVSERVNQSGAQRSRHSLGGIHYNIQIVLPSTRDPAIYDAIFRSLREHLVD